MALSEIVIAEKIESGTLIIIQPHRSRPSPSVLHRGLSQMSDRKRAPATTTAAAVPTKPATRAVAVLFTVSTSGTSGGRLAPGVGAKAGETSILTFMLSRQCPATEQMYHLVPGVDNVITLSPPVNGGFTPAVVLQILNDSLLGSGCTVCAPST